MISYSLFFSFFIGVVLPALLIPYFPEVLAKKSLESGIETSSIIYLSVLFVFFTLLIYYNRFSELNFLKKCKENISDNINIAIISIVILYLGRIFYLIFIADSPYTLMVHNGTLTIDGGIFKKIINYFYIETSFRLYPLFQGIIILCLPRKFLPLFFVCEFAYASMIYSKFIIFINFIAIVLLYIDYKKIWHSKKSIMYLIFFSFLAVVLLIVLRELFGQLRQGEFDFRIIEFHSVISHALSRIQSLLSVFYTDVVFDNWLNGKTICRTVGYLVPDSIIPLPLSCQNIDEPVLIYYFGLSDLRLIEKDMFSLWGEPFANFGIFGVCLFIYLILLVNLLTKKLGANSFGLVFTWVVFINCFIAHQAWVITLSNIFVSFVILWLLQLISKRKRV